MPYIGFYSQGGGGGTPICNVGGAANSTVTTSLTGPYSSQSLGGVGVATNIMFGMSGQWGASNANRTVTQWSVDLATGIETIGSSVSIPAGLNAPSGIAGYPITFDSPIFGFTHQVHPSSFSGLGVMFPSGDTYLTITGSQWDGTGTYRSTYFNGELYTVVGSYVRKQTIANLVAWDSGSTPTFEVESVTTVAPQSMAVDSSYVYVLATGTTNIRVFDKSTLALVTTLTHPAGVNGGNIIYVDEYGLLWAARSTGVWKHNGSDSWTLVNSSPGSAMLGTVGARHVIYRHVLYGFEVPTDNGNYSIYKSIPPC